MAGLDKKMPLDLAEMIHDIYPDLTILMLVNNNSDLRYFGDEGTKSQAIDRVFVWNGDSKVFLATTKYVEDKKNVANDTAVGDARVILLVEDSIRYYTRYLPILYSILMMQTQKVVQEHSVDDLHKILKMRGRPKILLAANYEEAESIINEYADNLLCVISDVTFKKEGKKMHQAGVLLLKEILSKLPVPCLMQSGEIKNQEKAQELGIDFLWKDSETVSHEIQSFLSKRCGFGDFIFQIPGQGAIAKASTIEEFEEIIHTIPEASLLHHAKRQGMSAWFMAHSEINIAKQLRRHTLSQTPDPKELRQYIIDTIRDNHLEKLKGRVIGFNANYLHSSHFISRLGNGSLGGKGRGLAFISHFIENVEFSKILSDIHISTPKTAIVGVEEFDLFIEQNDLYDEMYAKQDIQRIKESFVKSDLSDGLKAKLRAYLKKITKPLAVRSSGLFEDSMLQPFAGVYSTYFLPNNASDIEVRIIQLETAIKLVYSSIFSDTALNYFEATKYKIEEERMAVIIQEMVGQQYGDYFYPHISGVAQSFNYYPFAYMKPNDGFSVIAVGMGDTVVGGEKSHRFCPNFPKLEILSIGDQIKDSQTHFYALDMTRSWEEVSHDEKEAITKLPIKVAEEDGNIKHSAQVYDFQNQRLGNDFRKRGPRVVNFANILKYEHAPLAKSLSVLLEFFEQAMGSPVEIEYAVELGKNDKSTLYLLQIKPLIKAEDDILVNIDTVSRDNAVMMLQGGMGNGHYTTIEDVIYMNIERFDKSKTAEMANEIAELNKQLQKADREYVLIGVGRWGTRDKFIGIPVFWSQIANARIIVEMGLEELPLEASLGSHFFHNVTSMNVGYFSAPHNDKRNIINLELLDQQKVINETTHFKHVRFEKPLNIRMDGKNRIAVVETT